MVFNSVYGEEGVSCTGLSSEYTLANIHMQLQLHEQTSAIQELCFRLHRDLSFAQSSDYTSFSFYFASAVNTWPAYPCVQSLRHGLPAFNSHLLHLSPFLANWRFMEHVEFPNQATNQGHVC